MLCLKKSERKEFEKKCVKNFDAKVSGSSIDISFPKIIRKFFNQYIFLLSSEIIIKPVYKRSKCIFHPFAVQVLPLHKSQYFYEHCESFFFHISHPSLTKTHKCDSSRK